MNEPELLTSAPSSVAICSSVAPPVVTWSALAASAASAASFAFSTCTAWRTLGSTSASSGSRASSIAATRRISQPRDELDRLRDLAALELERLGGERRAAPETGDVLVAGERSGALEGHAFAALGQPAQTVGGGDLVVLDLGRQLLASVLRGRLRSIVEQPALDARPHRLEVGDTALAPVEDLDQVEAGLTEQIGLDRSDQIAGLAVERRLFELGVVAPAAEEAELATAILGGLVLRVLRAPARRSPRPRRCGA